MDDLDFPNVTVCPPKGSNTALNYDLMKANNGSFSNEARNLLKGFVWKNFVSDPHMIYIEEMLELVSPSDPIPERWWRSEKDPNIWSTHLKEIGLMQKKGVKRLGVILPPYDLQKNINK